LATLAGNPNLRLAVVCDADGDPVPVAVAIRGKGTCEVAHTRSTLRSIALLELVARRGGTLQ
jgi:hypothetical protein